MIETELIEDAVVLIPNKEHQNFTETDEVISAGTKVSGEAKIVKGLRRGKPCDYRLFVTDDNKIIFLNKTKIKTNMGNREVTLGVGGEKSIVVNDTKPKKLGRPVVLGAIGGALAGFGYCKYKGHDMKKTVMYALVGGAIGYVAGYVYENKGLSIKINK
jgi:hypothetical protein